MAKTITLLKEVGDAVKTPQIKVILATLEKLAPVGEPVGYADLVKAVDANENFVSRQGAAKVIRFYEKAMTEQGLALIEGSDKPEPKGKPPAKPILADGEEKPKTERKASKRAKAAAGEHAEHVAAE